GERNVRNRQRGRGAIDRENVGIVLAVRTEQDRDDLRVVKVTLWEKRTEWPIDHPRCECFLFGRTSFAFEVAAREFSSGGGFFTVIDRERKIILTFFDRGGGDCPHQYLRLAARNHDCATGDLA